ncbi:response regulator [Candidatus Pacearchaeota archaeon]|nr:response regulator [Candidatus Pacearchaeota archaeon]
MNTILIVDDDEGVAFTIENYILMSYEDIECVTFSTKSCGKDALIWLKNNKPDWAILDLILNGVSGFKIVNSILEKYEGTPILIISGCAPGSDETIKASTLTMDHLHIKFASKMKLTKTIEKEAKGII